jgi:hypothetical protein
MKPIVWSRSRVIAAGAAVAVAGGVLLAGVASAQSPSPSPSPGTGQQGQHQRMTPEQRRSEFADRLAQALGKSPADVEAALQQAGFPPERGQRDAQRGPQDPQFLAPAATQLGVTNQQLADAMKVAVQQFFQNRPQRQPGQNQGQGQGQQGQRQRPDMTAFYAAVAQQLNQATGKSLTAEQVQSALEALRSQARQTINRQEIQARIDAELQKLATALNVTVDQLKAALQQMIGPGHRDGGMRPGGGMRFGMN